MLKHPSQTVLVLEDDASSRFVLRAILERGGFKVVESIVVADAIEICRSRPETITIMISDVVLRGPRGPEAVAQLRAFQPGMAILFISGYPLDQLEDRGMLRERDLVGNRVGFLQKPFTAMKLLGVVEALIAGRQAAGYAP